VAEANQVVLGCFLGLCRSKWERGHGRVGVSERALSFEKVPPKRWLTLSHPRGLDGRFPNVHFRSFLRRRRKAPMPKIHTHTNKCIMHFSRPRPYPHNFRSPIYLPLGLERCSGSGWEWS
jgi:hypothetical protein